MPLKKFFVLSLALHALLFLALWLWPHPRPAESSIPIEIEVREAPAPVPMTKSETTSRSLPLPKSAAKAKGVHLQAEALTQRLLSASVGHAPGIGATHSERSWDEGEVSGKDDPNVEWGAGGGSFARIEEMNLMQFFYRKFDAVLFYPEILARHKIGGVVNARIVLNRSGECDWQKTQIRAAEPYLRVYVLHMLKNVCHENFKSYTRQRESTNIDISVNFSISEQPTTDELVKSQQRIVGNVLLLFRNSQHSVAEWRLGPFTGLFPIPAVSLDFGWLQEHMSGGEDPFQEFRDEL